MQKIEKSLQRLPKSAKSCHKLPKVSLRIPQNYNRLRMPQNASEWLRKPQTISDHLGTLPDHLGTLPDHLGALPDHLGALPGHLPYKTSIRTKCPTKSSNFPYEMSIRAKRLRAKCLRAKRLRAKRLPYETSIRTKRLLAPGESSG